MSYQHVHLFDPVAQQLVGPSTSLLTSQAAARSYALQQAVAERRGRSRPPQAPRVSVWQRARRVVRRPQPA